MPIAHALWHALPEKPCALAMPQLLERENRPKCSWPVPLTMVCAAVTVIAHHRECRVLSGDALLAGDNGWLRAALPFPCLPRLPWFELRCVGAGDIRADGY